MHKSVFNIRFEKIIYGGDAIGRLPDGRIIMVPGLLPGEAAAVEVTNQRRDCAKGTVRELLEASPYRCEPGCPFSFRCPGCKYDFCSSSAEKAVKRRQLREFLKHLPAGGVATDAVAASPEAESLWNYRNKITLVMERSGGLPQLGYRMDNGRILDIPHCKLASDLINSSLTDIRQDPGFMASLHRDMRLTLRTDAGGNVHIRRNSAGNNNQAITQILPDGKDFLIPEDGFFQVNPHGLKLLWDEVGNILRTKGVRGTFVDAYAGSGFFSCCAAANGTADILAVESQSAAAGTAIQNFALRGRQDIRISTADAEVFLQETLPGLPSGSVVLIDPPRRGISVNTLKALASSGAERIIYVSCDPSTLARDLTGFVHAGFAVVKATALPMFPRCAAFESVVELERPA